MFVVIMFIKDVWVYIVQSNISTFGGQPQNLLLKKRKKSVVRYIGKRNLSKFVDVCLQCKPVNKFFPYMNEQHLVTTP